MSARIPAPVRPAPLPMPASSPVTKAGPVGPGAGVLMTEYLLPTIMGNEPQQRMARSLKVGMEVDWVRAAERIIASKVAGCAWHLEDPDEETIDAEYPDKVAAAAFTLLEDPQKELPLSGVGGIGRRQSRRQLLGITSRHMGLAGNAGWYLDLLDGFGCPHAIVYLRPDRLTPACTDKGVLTGWTLDKSPGHPGTPVPLEQLALLQYQQPDAGIFGMGLIETSMAKAINNGLIDRHYSALLASGGRISGILAPREGAITDDNVYQQLIRDWRNITEQPEAARRLQIVRAPVDFTSTVQSVGEMQIIDLMYHNRDSLLALWGVPLSMLGGAVSSGGLNSGDSRKYDEASLWQGAVHDRLTEVREVIQSTILDRWEAALGWAPKLVFDEPEFDDELPNFEKLAKAAGTPLRNKERRAIIGLDPFGDEVLDNAIWMPVQVVAMAMAPDEQTGKIPEAGELAGFRMVDNPVPVPEEPGKTAMETPAVAAKPAPAGAPGGAKPAPASAGAKVAGAKARLDGSRKAAGAVAELDTGVVRLRENLDRRITPRLTDAVQAALDEQKRAVAAAVEKHWDLIVKHGGTDDSMWWPDPKREDARLMRALEPGYAGVSEVVVKHIADVLDPDDQLH